MTSPAKPDNELEKLRLANEAQRKIINEQRLEIAILKKELPTDDLTRKRHMFHYMMGVGVIHRPQNNKEKTCKGA